MPSGLRPLPRFNEKLVRPFSGRNEFAQLAAFPRLVNRARAYLSGLHRLALTPCDDQTTTAVAYRPFGPCRLE